jgi:hypothetical protein
MSPAPPNPVAERLIAELAEALHADPVVRGIIREMVERWLEEALPPCWKESRKLGPCK